MKNPILKLAFILWISPCNLEAQAYQNNQEKLIEDVNYLINQIETSYVYLSDKGVDLNCLRDFYTNKVHEINSIETEISLYENLLNEFYDSHIHLNTNTQSSYRLYAPLYISLKNDEFYISEVWESQINPISVNLIGAKVISMNDKTIKSLIDSFPSSCNDKKNPDVKEWIANKIVAGKYNESRIFHLLLSNGKKIKFDLDEIDIKSSRKMLSFYSLNNIGIIRINNSLGNNDLIEEFDETLNGLSNTKGLIIDLRNTISGGNSYVARGILSRFINRSIPYQIHSFNEKYGDGPLIPRKWMEFVNPRGKYYNKPVVVLVGRWTASMGEGLAIGFDSLDNATVVGTEMYKLAGAVNNFNFENRDYGYQLSTERLFHVNGTPREKYIPKHVVNESNIGADELMNKAILLLNN